MKTNKLQFTVISNVEDLETIKHEWSELLDHAIHDSFFLTYEWIYCWWRAYSKPTDRMLIVLIRDASKVVAIAPLMKSYEKRYGFRLNVLRFIGEPQSDRSDVIIRKSDIEEDVFESLFEFLVQKIDGWEQMHLREVHDQSNFYRWLVKNIKKVYVEPASDCLYLPLKQWSTWDKYFKSRSKSTKKKVKNLLNQILKSGAVATGHIPITNMNDPLLDEATKIEQENKPEKGIKQLVLHGEKNKNFQKLLLDNRNNYELLLSVLIKNNRLVAYNLGYCYKKIYYFYNTAYCQKEAKFSPGLLILKETIHFLKQKNVEEFDFLRGINVNKKRWATNLRKQKNIYYLKNSMKNRLYSFMVFSLRPFIKRLLFRDTDK